MKSGAAIAALARADLLERVRRYSFLVTLAFVLWLGIGTFDGTVSVNVSETQGVTNAAWVGGMMTIVAVTFLSLAGFWVVKNAVDRDERTGVGPILATTPLTRVEYVLGKALSHLLVLGTMVGILALCGLALLLLAGGRGGPFDPVAFLAPFVLCAIPAFALTAALAMVFETTPILRSGAGNVLWMFAWVALLMAGFESKSPLMDPWGVLIIQRSMGAAAHAQLGVDPEHFSVEMNPGSLKQETLATFTWTGVRWTPEIVLSRIAWLLVAIAIAALAAVPFHRFDPARKRMRMALPGARRAARPKEGGGAFRALVSRLPSGMVGSELRLLLGGANGWWALVALGLVVAGWLAPLTAARSGVLIAAWLWPLLLWSSLGARDARDGTEAFILSAPRGLTRQLPAAWLGGVLLAAVMGSGIGVRLAMAGDGNGFAAWLAAVCFIPALALALGLVSRGNKLFEVTYTVLWYAGPLNHVSALDFMAAGSPGRPLLWFAMACISLVAAFAVRARQLRG